MATLALALYTIVLTLLTMQRVGDWDSEVTLWADAATKSPQMLRPHLRLADALLRERGEAAFAAAEASYLRAIALRPHHPASRNNLLSANGPNRFGGASFARCCRRRLTMCRRD